MPVLDPIPTLLDAPRRRYIASLATASEFAHRLPLVHILVRWRNEEDPDDQCARDVLADGFILRTNKSDATREQETELGIGDILYLHAGRTDPSYGDVVFVFDDLDVEDLTATPFGIGGLRCKCPTECQCDSPDGRCQKGCMWPVAHWDTARQKEFVNRSMWPAERWRQCTADYLALYFGGRLDAYFADDETGRPGYPDPEGLFEAGGVQDWRAWTVEIQVCEDLDLRAHLAARRVRLWGHSPRFADYFGLDTVLDPFAQAPEERYPLLRELWALRTITSTRTAPGAWLDDVDDEIREHVLAAT